MKKLVCLLLVLMMSLSVFALSGCELIGSITGSGDSNVHTSSYDAITGRFYLYEAADKRASYYETYFDIDGSDGNFSLKYYENGALKKEGKFQKIVTREDRVGYMTDNLHFNVKCGDTYEHIGAYTESFEPLYQFRIIEEYRGGNDEYKYYYSELPFALGTYVKEGASYIEEAPTKNTTNYRVPTLENYTSELNGRYELDAEHYFYFISPAGYTLPDGDYLDSYFQYFSPELDKPIEGFAHGVTYKDSIAPPRIYFTYSREPSYYDALEDNEASLMFGYSTFKADDTMIDHYGSIDFSDGELKSFSFEHLSRSWTEAEWDEYTKNTEYKLPDAIIYEYVGGTYSKVK